MDDDYNSDSGDGCDGAELLTAAEEGRGADAVMSILEKNPSLIRTGDPVGNTVLHMAARDGDIVTVCKLIAFLEERHDEDLKEVFMDVNCDGDTALHLALKNRHREVAYHLISAEEWTANVRNNDGIFPYELAKEAGFREVCELAANEYPPTYDALVDVEMEAVNQDLMVESRNVHAQRIELEKAINKGEEDVLIAGLMRGGNELLWHQEKWGDTLLHVAVTAREMGLFRKLVQFMISNGLTDAALLGDRNGNTALHRATENEEFNKAICLIKAEPRAVYQVNHCGESPLYLAVKLRHEDLVEHMVTQSCLPRDSEMLRHPKHATLAHLAIEARSFSTLKLLLKHLPELVKGTNETGWRPLSYAANKGYLDEVTYILTNFPESAEKRDKDGSFPIHKAVGGGHVSIVKAFYELCPQSLHHVYRKGRNVVQIVASNDRADMLAHLTTELKLDDIKFTLKKPRDHDNNSDSDDSCDGAKLFAAAEEGLREDVLLILVKNPGLIRTGDPKGNTVLHMAARDGDIGTVCNLIEFLEERQDKDLKMVFTDVNVDGDTALHLALKNGFREVAYHLVKAEMWTRNICNNDGIYPYELAKEIGISEVCEFAFITWTPCSAKADVEMTEVKRDLMDKSRSVPVRWNELRWAIKKGDEDVLIAGLMSDGKELLWHQDNRGETLLHVAVTAHRMGLFTKLVKFMISNDLTDAALLGDEDGSTALHRATVYEEFSKAICLIKAEPRAVYQVNHFGESPLYLAVKLRHEDLIEHMVTQSCLPRDSEMLRHPKHVTLAHLAIKARSFGTLKLLLKHLPELVKGKDEKGWRPLSYAANKGRYLDEVTYILTNFPKSAEKRDNDGSFPIHKAVGGGHLRIVTAFYELCPETLHHIDRKGRNVLHIAASYERADILTYLTKSLSWMIHSRI